MYVFIYLTKNRSHYYIFTSHITFLTDLYFILKYSKSLNHIELNN